MVRPRKNRFVWGKPILTSFRPGGIRISQTEYLTLSVDEFEAIRLADFEGLYQEEAAKMMKISRQTFGRILQEAHRKIAESLVQGKLLKIEGGNYVMSEGFFYCRDCENRWVMESKNNIPQECPECKNTSIRMIRKGQPFRWRFGRGRGPRRGHGPPWR
ncbi:MAG TPA: DUF134 domain-containing protein [Nitrospinota bacterium]|nr:DUF134 domain-containing protein [Nitrospinota bacterium]